MTGKKERPSYDVDIIRRATVDDKYNFYELKAIIDPTKIDAVTVIRDIEKIVTFARELTAPKEFKKPKIETTVLAKGKGALKPKRVVVSHEPTEDTKIADLENGDKKVNINVRFIENAGDIKSFTKNDGSKGMFSKIKVEDESGDEILLTAWDNQAVNAQKIKENAWVFLQSAYVTEYQGNLELNVGNWSKMEVKFNG